MTAPAVQPPPRERAPAQYQELNEQRYRSQVDEELAQKHDKRSNLRLGRGKSLILSAPGGLEFALALDNDGFITVTNYSTGDVGELTVRFDNVEGLAQEFIDVRAEFAAADGSLSSAYIAADAVVAADAASANASLSTTLTAAYQAADSTVASNAAALVTSEASTRAAADTAIASDVTALTARVTTAEGDINTVEATAAAIDGRLVTVEGSYATASSVSSLTATVNTKARTFSQTSAPTATATGDLWIDTDDNNRLYRWSGTAWVEVTDPRIASSASTLTTVTADITTLETAVADLDATKAEASTVSSLSATVTSIGSSRNQTFAQTSAPTAVTTGDLWVDTDDNNKIYRWSGSAWVAVDDSRISTKARTFVQTSAPTATAAGDLWFDSDDNNKLYRWSGSAWVAVDDARIATNAAAITTEASARASGDSANATSISTLSATVTTIQSDLTAAEADIVTALANAATAQATADGKIQTFYQTSAPTAEGVGDLWFDTDDGNKQYRWSGSAWVDAQDTAIGDAISAAAGAQATADGKITSFYQTSAPTAEGVGDLWIDTDDNNKLYRWSGSAWVAVDDARIATNAAAITTESTARASGDSANATSITNLTASVSKTTKQLIVNNFDNDGHFWTSAFGGTPESVADPTNFTYVDVASIGRVAQATAYPRYLTPKAVIKPYVGMKLRLEAKVRATVDPSSGSITAILATINGLSSAWAHGTPSLVASAVTGYSHQEVGLTVADGWVTIARFITCTGISTFDAGWRPRLDFTHTGSGGTVQIAYFRIEDVTEMAAQDAVLSASITTESSARASGDSANATSITTLTASVNAVHAYTVPISEKGWCVLTASANSAGLPSEKSDHGGWNAAGYINLTGNNSLVGPKVAFPAVSGRIYEITADIEVTASDGTCNPSLAAFSLLDNYTATDASNFAIYEATAVSTGRQTITRRYGVNNAAADQAVADVSTVKLLRFSAGIRNGGVSATGIVYSMTIRDVTEEVALDAAITTEASARASGDSANATLITSLQAKVRGLTLPDRPSEADDFTGGFANTTTFTAPALTEGTQATIANEGVVRQFTSSEVASNALANRAVLQLQTGKTYEVRLRARVTTDATTATNVMAMGFRVFNASGTYLGDHAFATTENPFNVADGWLEETVTATTAAIITAHPTAAYIRAIGCVNRRLDTGGLNNAVTEVAILRLSDISLGASVTTTASAVADIEGRLAASYAIQVDGGGNGALVSLEDGTELGSVVKLAADKIELAAEAINFGDDTVYEDTHNTFYTVGGAYRYRDRGPFGASSDLLVWYGLNSVALNSETKTNGIFAIATDGKTYFGTSPLDDVTAPLEISFSPASWDSSHTAAGTLNQAVEATVTGGSGTYTYFWSVADVIQGGRPTLTNTTTDTVTVNRSYLTVATIEGTISVEVRDTVTGKSARRFWGYLDVYDDGGGGGGSGGALPP